MPLWIAVIGSKKSGKTSIIEELIPLLKKLGYRVATLKHTVHQHSFDREGTDSYRHAEAGADRVGIISHGKLVLFAYDLAGAEEGLDAFTMEFFNKFDIVLCEGYRDSKFAKIVLETDESKPIEIIQPVIAKFRPVHRQGFRPSIPTDVQNHILHYIRDQLNR